MPKQTRTADEARAALKRGVDAVVNPVKITLGPRGRNVMLDRAGQPLATRDGVTVAKEVSHLPDPFENMGAAYAREVADAAVTEAGDGTTTASVLLQAIFDGGLEAIKAGAEPLQLAAGIEAAAAACIQHIKDMAIDATPEIVEQVAIISTHGDRELGKIIAETSVAIGDHGVLELLESRDHNTTVERVEGYHFERGWAPHHAFLAGQSSENIGLQRVELKNPVILLSERVIVGASGPDIAGDHLFAILQQCVMQRRSLLIIADDLQGDALNLFTLQVSGGAIPGGCFVKLPGFGEQRNAALKDLETAIGAKRIHSQSSTRVDDVLSTFTLDDLGSCERAMISPTRTVLVKPAGNPIKVTDRIETLKKQRDTAENPLIAEHLNHRIARLAGGTALLRVGAHSEPAMIEKKARAEDAIHACRGALQAGVVPGGGTALLRAAYAMQFMGTQISIGGQAAAYVENAEPYVVGTAAAYSFKDERKGAEVLLEALRSPALHIARNAGHADPEAIVNRTASETGDFGFDAAQGTHTRLMEAGVVDPAKVVITALSKAASVGALLLTTEALVTDLPEERRETGPQPFRIG